MDIRQLSYFLVIAKEEQITRAAKVLHMEQPPLSRQLKLLEQELGVTLFDRQGKQMKLTPAGESLKRRAESLLDYFNETIKEVKDIENGLQGTLSVGSVFSSISLLPPKISHFHERHPRVIFKILEGDHFTLGEYLENRNIELVVTRLPFESNYDSSRYSILRLPSDPFVAVIPRTWDFLTSQQSIPMKGLADLPLLALKSDKTIRLHEKIVDECRRFGFEPNIICECSSVAIIIALVVTGIGATILPKSVMSSFPISEIKMLDIPDTSFQSEVGIVWLKNRYLSKSAQAFIDTFQHEIEQR
ncbi:LysR family transcriptional regulator [Paenibacillus sediminis]|uniref:DNA-binding transcriptional LysR family regulator n=1 Tax=Paenibacillus sediminis TaxID=664909 RepID=A0ABS4H500_9BACL|nr:LysR family transcriptional regulator [Paenibacillus sediminis]MBP1937604.1 DNA-binding transcriptional LysR family regulator [Paenibacillus sediminis]